MGIQNKSVLIFGGSSPLGRMASKMFIDAGAKVIIGWNQQKTWDDAKEFLSGYESRYFDCRVDVKDEESVKKFVDFAKEKCGSIDVMLYMAGAFSIGPRLWETETDVFDNLFAVNTRGAFLAAKYVVPVMLEGNKGNIFFFPAKSVVEAKPRFETYAVSKGALLTLMEGLCAELKETDITINAVMPDAIDTWKTRQAPNATPDKWVKTQEVAELLINICSMENNIVNGAVLKCFGK